MALLSLKQLLRGVFVIAAPPTMGVGTSEEYQCTAVGCFFSLVTLLFAFVIHRSTKSLKHDCEIFSFANFLVF